MFDDTVIQILGNSPNNTKIKSIFADVQEYDGETELDNCKVNVYKRLYIDYLDPLVQINTYLNINNEILKVVKVSKYSDYLEVFMTEVKNIKVNSVDKVAIIIDATEKINELDEKIIVTDFSIYQGDLVFYDSTNWLITSEVDTSKNTYRARITKCNADVKFPIGVAEYAYRYNYNIPVIVIRSAFNVTTNQYMSLADGEVYITVRLDNFTKWKGYNDFISLGSEIIKFGYGLKIEGIDQTKKGLVTYHAKVTQTSTQIMDMGNESVFFEKKYEINANSIDNLKIGSTAKPTVQILQDSVDITDKVPIYYTSLTPDTISVDDSGNVTPIIPGTAKIKIFSQGVSKYLGFNVKAIDYSINILNKTDNVGINYTYALNVVCYRDGVKDTNPTITYISSDTSIATVGTDGIIKGIKQGIVTITANYNGVSDSMNISIIPIDTISITNKINALKVGQSYNLAITCTENNILDNNPALTYTISNPNVLTVTNNIIKAIGTGTATIVITYKDKIDSITITAAAIVYAIEIANKLTTNLYIGDTLQLNTNSTIDGVADTNPTIAYASSDTNILTVSNTGLITCLAGGSATVTASYNGVFDSTSITVKAIPIVTAYSFKTVTLDGTTMTTDTITMDKGTTKTLKVTEIEKKVTQGATTISDEVISNPVVTYSSDTNVTIDNTGKITGVNAGSATITIAYENISKQINIVINNTMQLEITGKDSLALGRSRTYTSNISVVWSAEDVSNDGKVVSPWVWITQSTNTSCTVKCTDKWLFDNDNKSKYFKIIAISKDNSNIVGEKKIKISAN